MLRNSQTWFENDHSDIMGNQFIHEAMTSTIMQPRSEEDYSVTFSSCFRNVLESHAELNNPEEKIWAATDEKEKAMSQQEIKSYRPGVFRSSNQKYKHDLKRHIKRGWQLIACTVAGWDIFGRIWLTATYER